MVNAGGTALIYGSVFTYNDTPQVCLPAAPLAARSLQPSDDLPCASYSTVEPSRTKVVRWRFTPVHS